MPTVAVVVSTRNRSHLLPRLVAALERQTVTDTEVVIVDNGSTDDTASVLQELAGRTPLALRVLTGPGRGPGEGRDLGWRAATSPVVAFTDDDCVPAPEWLAEGLAAMGDHHRVVVGRTRPQPAHRHREGPFSRSMTVEGVKFFQTCNIFYRREHLARVDGFDHDFDAPGGEDTDLALRVVDATGAAPVFAPDALVHHDISPSRLADRLREATRWHGIPRFVAKHPDARRDYLVRRLFWRRSHPRVILGLVGLVGGLRDPRLLLLLAPWVRFRLGPQRLAPDAVVNLAAMPGQFLVDTVEVTTMLRGSARARTIVL